MRLASSHYLLIQQAKHHFSKARRVLVDPEDQAHISHPRIGVYVRKLDELNMQLLQGIAYLMPEFQFIIITSESNCPVTHLSALPNIHILGMKEHHLLPNYIASWDCAIIPSRDEECVDESTFIRMLELLVAGKPIVANYLGTTSVLISDAKLIHIANQPEQFAKHIELAMNECAYDPEWLERVDVFLEQESWNESIAEMSLDAEWQHRDYHSPRQPAYEDLAFRQIGIV